MALVVSLTPFAQYVDDTRIFELDANGVAASYSHGGDDWANAAGNGSGLTKAAVTTHAANSPTAFPFVVPDAPGETIFTTGGSKDTNDVSQWHYTAGSVPDKDEITNAYAAAYLVTTGETTPQPHLWLYFGADRYANNGDSNIGFWFFQNQIQLAGGSFTGTPGANGSLHRNGDLLIVSAFTQGGTLGTIQVFEWLNGSLVESATFTSPTCKPGYPPGDSNILCAAINTKDAPAPWPYTPKAGVAQTFPQGSFFEGGLDLTALFTMLGQPMPCFSSFLAETRSSQTPNAQLKDFVLGNFQLCSASITKACKLATVNLPGGSTVHYEFSGQVTNTGVGSIYDIVVSDSFPVGATNTKLNQPVVPAAGVAAGDSVTYTGYFDFPGAGQIINTASFQAAPASGADKTITGKVDWTACQPAVTPGLSLTKSCAVALQPVVGTGLVVQVNDSITICNTGNEQITGITLHDSVLGDIATGLSLDAPAAEQKKCQTYTPFYRPTTCTADCPGFCVFQDTVSVTAGTGTLSGASVEKGTLTVLPTTATCKVCPPGGCPQ